MLLLCRPFFKRLVLHWHAAGLATWATIDAGPHVKVLVHESDAQRVKEALAAVPGVLRVLYTRPGEGARLA